jgi:hypothetical protein
LHAVCSPGARGPFAAEEISIGWTADCQAGIAIWPSQHHQINGMHRASVHAGALINALQQQPPQTDRFCFHIVEFVFNWMIICNIYHTAVRKIGLYLPGAFATVD